MNARGPVFKYGDNIDTDVIIPARYLNTQSAAASWQATVWKISTKTFVTRVKAGDIMVGGENFGCGSSREHAPVAIKASRYQLRHRHELCPHLLPQCHQHRFTDSGMPRRQRGNSARAIQVSSGL